MWNSAPLFLKWLPLLVLWTEFGAWTEQVCSYYSAVTSLPANSNFHPSAPVSMANDEGWWELFNNAWMGTRFPICTVVESTLLEGERFQNRMQPARMKENVAYAYSLSTAPQHETKTAPPPTTTAPIYNADWVCNRPWHRTNWVALCWETDLHSC